ncbi:MAG: exodeoxyribonuclease VII small subunit [Gemmatimonadaceae bacterium]
MSYESDIARIEAIVTELERNDVELDRALKLFEEGMVRVQAAQQALSAAEVQVRRLVERGDGSFTLGDLGG